MKNVLAFLFLPDIPSPKSTCWGSFQCFRDQGLLKSGAVPGHVTRWRRPICLAGTTVPFIKRLLRGVTLSFFVLFCWFLSSQDLAKKLRGAGRANGRVGVERRGRCSPHSLPHSVAKCRLSRAGLLLLSFKISDKAAVLLQRICTIKSFN